MGKFFLFFFIFFSSFNFVNAEDGVPEKGIQISPTKISFDLRPGFEEKAIINVKNYDQNFSHEIEVQIEDFYVENESSNVQYFIPNEKHFLKAYDVINWIEVEKNFTLGPNESKNVEFKIKVPENTPTGGYYGAILFKTSETKEQKDSTAIYEIYRASVLLNTIVKGEEPVKIEGDLLQFFPKNKVFFGDFFSRKVSLKENLLNWSGTGSLITHLKNTGNVHFKIGGEIKIYKFGSHYKTLKLNNSFVYPQKIRVFDNKFNFRWWDFGIYRADINLTSEDKNIILNRKSVYWIIFPWKTFLAVFLFLIFNYLERKRNFRKKNNFI